MRLRNIIIGILVVAGIAAAIWWAYQPQPIGVDLGTAERGELVVTVDDEGVASIKETYQISTPVGGNVQRIPFTVGDLVTRDQIVATIVPQLSGFLDERSLAQAEAAVKAAEAAVVSAQADLEGAQSQVDYWQVEVDRSVRLLERGLTTQRAADQSEFELRRANVRLTNAQAALELRERQLDQAEAALVEPNSTGDRAISYEVRAPISAQVLEVHNESSRDLPAGSPLLTIGDPHNLEIIVDLLSTDAVRIAANSAATIDGWGGDSILHARVRRIEPVGFTQISALGVEEQRVRVHLEIDSPREQWQSLGHLYRVFVRIETLRKDDALLVPTAALFRDDNDWAVFTLDGGVAKLNRVTLGARNSGNAEVLSGLEAGAQVVLHPSDRITEGSLLQDRAALDQ